MHPRELPPQDNTARDVGVPGATEPDVRAPDVPARGAQDTGASRARRASAQTHARALPSHSAAPATHTVDTSRPASPPDATAPPSSAAPAAAAELADGARPASPSDATAPSRAAPAGEPHEARRRWLDHADREALGIWLLSRVAVVVAVSSAAWNLSVPGSPVGPFVERWAQWDFVHYRAVAEFWYASGRPTGVPLEAFFPGFPFSLWALHGVGLPHVVGGLVVSLVAGTVAMVALRRLGDLEAGPGAGTRTVLLVVTAPVAVFLAVPYTESLFLAFAVPAWLAARRGHWPVAALLAAGAGSIRVSGLFLAAALVVEFATSPRRGSWARAPWLLVPFVPSALFMAYLWQLTGDPLRWLSAQSEGWYREFTWPWDSLGNTWNAAFLRPDLNANYAWMFRAELVALALGAALTIGLLVWRRWGDATWVGLQVVAFATSYWFFSVPRATLLWWPLWIALAAFTLRRRWALWVYLAVSVPLMLVWTVAFTLGGHWTG